MNNLANEPPTCIPRAILVPIDIENAYFSSSPVAIAIRRPINSDNNSTPPLTTMLNPVDIETHVVPPLSPNIYPGDNKGLSLAPITHSDDSDNFTVSRKKYMPGLYYKRSNGFWRNGNQQSTYELCIYVRRQLTNNTSYLTTPGDSKWCLRINNIMKEDPDKYGTYARNHNWCHHFTDIELQNFYDLVENSL